MPLSKFCRSHEDTAYRKKDDVIPKVLCIRFDVITNLSRFQELWEKVDMECELFPQGFDVGMCNMWKK
jgi:hypothetical protein